MSVVFIAFDKANEDLTEVNRDMLCDPDDRSMPRIAHILLAVSVGAIGISVSCSNPEAPGSSYYDRNIAPILRSSCEGAVAPCHRDDGTGSALGNLDVSSFDSIKKRSDVLRRYGGFPESLLLIKAVGSASLSVGYNGEYYPMEVNHAGGPILQPGSQAYFTLKQWIDRGATETGLRPVNAGGTGQGACSVDIVGVDTTTVSDSDPGFAEFAAIDTYLVETCGAETCHGAIRADFHLTCGTTDDEIKANYLMARAFIAATVDDSPLLVKVLDPAKGGTFHVGGVFFDTRDAGKYSEISTWAETAGTYEGKPRTAAHQFFDDRVMPMLMQRGCGFEACHSPIVPFKVNLRPGSLGFFSPLSLAVNYKSAHKFLGLESPNPIASRLMAKNVVPSKGGIAHRAGPLLETPGFPDDPATCPTPYDPASARPLCTLAEWRRLERAELPADSKSDLSSGATVPLVYIERPPDAVPLMQFSNYRPGADLLRADATMGANASLASAAGRTSLIGGCPGVGAGRADVDVRGPEPSYDGRRIVFAMRIGESDGMNLYEVGVDGSGCRALTTDGGAEVNGIRVDNFDPFYYLADGEEWVVYASTRGGTDGPVRTPKLFLPASDVWRQKTAGSTPERLTYIRGSELQPFLMNNGMMGMVVEKVSPEFHQFAARRLDWDLSDYHPLLGQRKASYQGRNGYLPGDVPAEAVPIQSFGYSAVSEIRNALNDNFLVVMSETGARGPGGALGIFNRSVGPFEAGRDDPAFLKSLTVLPGPTGRPGEATGAYRSPYPLPDGGILASYAEGVDVGVATAQRYELVVLDAVTRNRRALISSSTSIVEAVLVIARPMPKPFVRKANTKVESSPDYAVLNYLDVPLLMTLQGANDRRGRLVESLRGARTARYLTQASPPTECVTAMDCADRLAGTQQVFDSPIVVGTAPIQPDGSMFIRAPTDMPIIIELLDDAGKVLFRMGEETQYGPYENINLAVPETAYGSLCAVCHGSISGRELDVTVDVDAVTNASLSTARDQGVRDLE